MFIFNHRSVLYESVRGPGRHTMFGREGAQGRVNGNQKLKINVRWHNYSECDPTILYRRYILSDK